MASKKNGTIQEFGINGELTKETEYVDGKKHGVQTCFDPDGNPAKKTRYENNNRVYEETFYKGAIVSKTSYFMGKKEGLCEQYENGVKVVETNYANGKKNGTETRFYPDGNVSEKTQYENGKKGDYERFFENGNVQIKVKDGIETRYSENGFPISEYGGKSGVYEYKEFYLDGTVRFHTIGGKERFYDPSGREISSDEYYSAGLGNREGIVNDKGRPITQKEYLQRIKEAALKRKEQQKQELKAFGYSWTKPLEITEGPEVVENVEVVGENEVLKISAEKEGRPKKNFLLSFFDKIKG